MFASAVSRPVSTQEARARAQRRFDIEQAYDHAVVGMCGSLRQVACFGGIPLYRFLDTYVSVGDIDNLAKLRHLNQWSEESYRRLLEGEIRHQLYYLVARVACRMGSRVLPERLRVTPAQGEMVRHTAIHVLREVFSQVPQRMEQGLFKPRRRQPCLGGDRAMDRKLFHRKALYQGLMHAAL